ncbi:DUF5689 domain-containing protein [Salinimicrobium catena]|uniref:DUF5689 domain-containing protein n=1 Tax=Salinimicrobium catena TaxID=390640 RepID=UPI002FE4A633
MKNLNQIFILLLLLLNACVAHDDFDLPETVHLSDVDLEPNSDLNAVLGLFYQDPDEIITFQGDLIFEAYVVSSDEAGNFYKELIVQDKPENPTAGLNIRINMNSYSQFYDFGRKLLINVNGLSIGEMNGVPTLGVVNGKQIENIPQAKISDHLFRTGIVAEIVPLQIEALQFNDRYENLFVELKNVQFSDFLVDPQNPFTYAAEDVDEFDGERLLESCTADFPFILSTSTYADFSSFRLPAGSGDLQGVLTRDFYDEFYTIYLNSPDDIRFTESRCEKQTLDCGLAAAHGSKILFSEDFSEQTNNKPIKGSGWKLIVQEGSKEWEAFTATGANASLGRSARLRPAGSGDRKTVSWLVSPAINFDTNTGEVLSFKTSTSFANGSMLEVLISTDWDGNEENFLQANWKMLSAAYIAQNSDFFGDWISSGHVDLSCVEGKGYIGFRYTGSDSPYYNGIYELDDVLVTAN